MKNNPIKIFAVFIYVVICTFLFLISCNNNQDEKNLILKVNGKPITLNDYKLKLLEYTAGGDESAATGGNDTETIKKTIIKSLIETALLEKEAERRGIKVSDIELKTELKRYLADYPGDTLKQLLMSKGVSYDDWLKKVRKNLLVEKTIAAIVSDITPPSEEEIKNYYEKNKEKFVEPEKIHLHQIVVKKREQAGRLWKIVAASRKRFAAIAKENSISPDAQNGGDMGFISRGTLPSNMEKKLFRLPKMVLSPVMKGPQGFYIFMVTERKPERKIPFEDVKDKIKEKLLNERKALAYRAWLKEKLRTAKILRNHRLISSLGGTIVQNAR